MISIKNLNSRIKKTFRISAFLLASVTALALTGCGKEGKKLSDDELIDRLSKSLGDKVEILEQSAPEQNETQAVEFTMKCADGTEFTVRRLKYQYNYFSGDSYYEYDCDYLMNWVHNHPELTTSLDEKGLSHENFGRGTKVYVRNFDEVHTAIEAACELVEDSSNNVPVLSDIDDDYKFKFMRPVVMVIYLDEKTEKTGTIFSEYEFSNGTDKTDYDEEQEVFNAEWEFVDDVRDNDIDANLSDEILKKFGPSHLKIKLKNSDHDLMLVKSNDKDISIKTAENLYYITDSTNIQHNEKLDFPTIATFAECTGFEPYSADGNSYTLARGNDKVVFHFSKNKCYVERNGKKTDLRGTVDEWMETSCDVKLTTDDLTKLFDTEFKYDFINETAEITNMKK